MAGDWIKVDDDLPDKPEVIAMARRLKLSREAIVGHLIRVWAWADRNLTAPPMSRFCHAPKVHLADIDETAKRLGFGDAMESVGWIHLTGEGEVLFPGWDQHMSKSAKTRLLATKRKRSQREKESRSGHDDVTERSRNDRDRRVTREERERESIRTPHSPPTGEPVRMDWKEHVEAWNAIAKKHDLPAIGPDLSDGRKKRLRVRLREATAACAAEFWAQIEDAVSRLGPWAREKRFVTFDWVLGPKNLPKLLEGNYEDKATSGRTTGSKDAGKFGDERFKA